MDNVNVAIRVRPLIQREKNADAEPQWKAETNKISQLDNRGRVSRIYAFDRVFDLTETTSDVYEEIALPIVEKAMDGVNGTIFAYGQTASGKTYTMMGDRMCPGIIPRAVQDIFTQIDNASNREFLLRVSYMELYNEGLSDLLSSEKKTLQIRENDKTVFVHDLTEEIVTNVHEVLQFLKKGEARRHFGQTDMNERSSRSHTIFRMIIESRETNQGRKSIDMAVKVSHLNLVDLAGSERANETKADGIRLREACKINQSLHVLAMVINKLSQGAEFIPFRDSKLTRILQMSLGGNAKTAIICTVTPISVEQTHSTLQFASRAKTIKNKPEVNEVVSDEAMMQRQKKEIQELKRKISELEQQGELFEEKSRLHETQEQKIKILEKMILVSGGAGISGIVPTNETTKAKYKRRQTWCPGMANHLPLLRPKPPSELASHIVEETLSSSETTSQSSRSPDEEMRRSDADTSPQESVTSVGSEEFSNTKQFQFWEDMEMEKETEDDIVTIPLNPQRKKRKRREAHVHFANFGAATVDADSQTEVNSPNATESLLEANARCSELQGQILALEDTVTTLRESGAVLSQVTESKESAEQQLADLMSKNQGLESKIQQLEEENLMASQLSDALCLSEEKVADLESRTQDADQQISTLTEDIRLLKAQLEDMNYLKESAEEKEQEAMKEQLDQQGRLETALSNSEQETVSLRAELEETKLLLASAEEKEEEAVQMKMQLDQQDGLKDSLQKSEIEIASLEAQLEEYEVRLAPSLENEQKVLDLTAQHDQLKNLFEKSEQEILALKEELQEHDSHMASLLEDKEKVLKSQLEQQDSLKELLLSKEQEILALTVKLEERQNLLASVEENALEITQMKELTKALSARQEENNALNLCLVEQGKEAEETRNHHIARIAELTALLEDQQGQVALAAGPSMGCVESVDEPKSLADEIEEQNWKVKARRTESDLLGSVQLCEDIMEEKAKLSVQVSQFQNEVTNLRGALKAKEVELEELEEFTQMEMTVMKEQEAQYQSDIKELRLELQEKQDALAVQQHKEIEDLQKKLSVKDKVLEAQYQQDVDELLEKLREKNHKLDNLQEQQSGIVQAASLAEQKVEQLQCQLRDLEGCGTTKGNGSVEGQDQAAFQRLINQQVQTEEHNKESSLHTAVSVLEGATQVSPEDLGLLVDGSSVQPEIFQQRIDELESIEASLRQDCETLNATVSSQDQEIEVLNELLEDLGQETKDNKENNAKMAAFVERIEQLEKQLQERELPTTEHIKQPDVDLEIQVLSEVNENLSKALTEAERSCENLRAKVLALEEALKHEVSSNKDLDLSKEKDLMNLRKELEALNEVNFCLSEKLTCTQELCEKLEGKLLQSTKEEKRESEEEIHALTAVIEQQGQEMASQRVKLEEAEDNLRSNVRDLEDSVASLTRENQSLAERCVLEATRHEQFVEDIKSKDILLAEQQNKLSTLSERLARIEEELQGRTITVQELDAALASQSSQSAEAAEIIIRRDGELEMLREVLQEQEQQLESVRNEFSQAQFRVKDLEREVKFLNETKGDQMVNEGQKENEIHRLHGLLENQEEQLRTKERHLMEFLSKIQNLESVLAANNHMNLEKSKAEAEQNAKVHKLQNYLEELENQLRAKEITCSELEAKLQDLERVVAASGQKRVDQEDVKQKLESEVKTLQGYLDEVDEELHQFKNRYAFLQADFRKQQANIKNMEAVLESRSRSTKMLEAAVAKHDEQVGVLRALLDERNHTALKQEDRYSDMLAKIQNLEGIITSKEQTAKELEDSLKIQDSELRRLQAAHTSFQEQQDSRLQEEISMREEEILNLQQQLEKATTDRAKLDDLEVQRSSVDELMKTHRQQLAEKNLHINKLETDLLRGTDPLERKLVSMKEELSYQESKVQQYKKEVEKLRSQQSQTAPSASSTTLGSSSISERTPEATGGSGIIESCAIFAVKAENYKLTKALEKTKKELEYKDLKYHDEVTKKTHAEQDARYWKEKARSLASHLKRAPQRNESVTASPLKERNTNDDTLVKKPRSDDSAGTRYVEKIAGLKSSSSAGSSSSSSSLKRPDYNWLSKAVAERDAEEKPDDDPQQCATQ